MKTFKNIVVIFIIETILFWIFLRYFYIPKMYDESEIISINVLAIILIGINVFIFLILHFWTKSLGKQVFLINVFLSPLVLVLVFNKADTNYFSENFLQKTFQSNYNKYGLFVDTTKKTFLLTRTDVQKNKSNILFGTAEILKDKILLKTGQEKYIIENDSIKGIEGENFKLKP